MLRSITLFIHIVSALTLFAALGAEWLALIQLGRAQEGATARAALAGFRLGQHLTGPGMLLLLLSGLRLATAYWHWQGPWIRLGLAGLVVIGLIGGLMTGRRVRRLQQRLSGEGPGTPWSGELTVLRTSFALRTALLVGVVYLMTVKPG